VRSPAVSRAGRVDAFETRREANRALERRFLSLRSHPTEELREVENLIGPGVEEMRSAEALLHSATPRAPRKRRRRCRIAFGFSGKLGLKDAKLTLRALDRLA
jgi:hypothetical protein